MYMYMFTEDCERELMLSAHVVLLNYQLTITLLAHMALVRFLVRVNTHVDFQSTRFTKTFSHTSHSIRFLVRVNTHVDFQITRLTKTLLAHITLVRFLFRVNTHVDFQITQIHENASRTHHTRTASRSCELRIVPLSNVPACA